MSERVTWQARPDCGRSAAVGWLDGSPIGFAWPSDCSPSLHELTSLASMWGWWSKARRLPDQATSQRRAIGQCREGDGGHGSVDRGGRRSSTAAHLESDRARVVRESRERVPQMKPQLWRGCFERLSS